MHFIFAKMVSAVLHPALIPTYLFAILLFFSAVIPYQLSEKLMFLGIIFLLTFVFPVLCFFFFFKAKLISSIEIPKREERIFPFLVITIFYILVTYGLFYYFPIVSLLGEVMLGITIVLIVVSITTFFYKISVHGAGVSGGLGALSALQYGSPSEDLSYPILLFVLLVCITAYARLALKAHTAWEVVAGVGVGFTITFLQLFLGY